MSKERGIKAHIVPVGLNYEKGTTFRSRVLVSIAPPLDPAPYESSERGNAIRQITEALKNSLEQNVVQAESYQERELMQLLERLSTAAVSDSERFSRLKAFERGLIRLRTSASHEIETLRRLLSRYDRLSRTYGVNPDLPEGSKSLTNILQAFFGAVLAVPGWVLNWVPYRACDWLIRITKRNASDVATFKVIYSLFLFPICYFLVGWLIHRYSGGLAALIFALLILPASFYTLFFHEWYQRNFGGILWFRPKQRIVSQLERLQTRISATLQKLASRN